MTVVPARRKHGLFDAKVLAAHCVHIDHNEIRALKNFNAGVAHCPTSNLKLASGIAPVTQMLKLGVNVGIGTDGPASNNDLDMFEEMRLAAILAKHDATIPTAVPARQALLMATRQGAAALFMDDVTGRLEAGKRADVIVLDADPLHNCPHSTRDPNAIYSRIVYAGKVDRRADVMCNGRWLMRDRELLTRERGGIDARGARVCAHADRRLPRQREVDRAEKLLAIGGASSRRASRCRSRPGWPATRGCWRRCPPRADRHPLEPLPPARLVLSFDDPDQGRLRYRDDELLDDQGAVTGERFAVDAHRPDARRPLRRSAALPVAIPRPGRALRRGSIASTSVRPPSTS